MSAHSKACAIRSGPRHAGAVVTVVSYRAAPSS